MMFRKCQLSVNIKVVSQHTYDDITNGMFKGAKRHVASPNLKNLYVTVAGLHWDWPANDNGDMFPKNELLKLRESEGIYAYQTWNQRPNCVDHNLNVRVGTILDTAPIFKERSIDMLLEVEPGRYKLAGKDLTDLIRNGSQNKLSMGVIVQSSECSKCGNIATTEDQWCNCLRYAKGSIDPDTGEMVAEINHDLHGLEVSWICGGMAADRKALMKEVL